MKVKINSLPDGYSIVNGKVYRDGGSTTGDQSNYGLVQFPLLDNSSNMSSPFDSINYTLDPVPRDEANLEAEKGETVLTDMNNDGDFELYEIPGKRHHKGGTPLNLPPQSFIYSDTSKMKLNKYELAEMNLEYKKKMTPAKISKNYQLNNFIGLLDNEHSDKITKDTANYMLDKNKRSLSQLAFLQEAKKEFEDGVPLAAYPYLTEKGIDPIDFSQKVEDITRKEAEQKMLMQLPIEEQMQLLLAKEQAQQQAQRQQQQNELIKQGQMPPSMMNQQAPNPNQDMAIQQQISGQGMQGPQGMPPQGMPPQGMPPQGMPPQGMMPPQPPMGDQAMMPPPQQMQQPMQQPAMAKRGGQISLLNRKRGGRTYLPKAQNGIYDITSRHQDLSVLDAGPYKTPAHYNQRDKYSGEQLKAYDYYAKGHQDQLDWLNSPMAYKMILESVGGDEDVANWLLAMQRKNLGYKPDIRIYSGDDEGYYANDPEGVPLAYSRTQYGNPYVGVYPIGYDSMGTPRHEFSHQSDQRPDYWDTWWHGWDYEGKRLIPLDDVEYMEDNAKSLSAFKEDEKWGDSEDYEYYSDPTEVRARINALRGVWFDEGIYDPHNEKLSKSEFDKIWNKRGKYHPLQQLEYIYDKDEIFHMMNNFVAKPQIAMDENQPMIDDSNLHNPNAAINDKIMGKYGVELPHAAFGLDLGGYFRGEQGWIPDIGGKSTTETWQDTSGTVQKYADMASMTGIPGLSHIGGYTSAAIDYGDAALAYSQGDYDTMKKELAKGTLTAGLTTVPAGNLLKNTIKGGSKILNLSKGTTNLLTSAPAKGVIKDQLIKKPVKNVIDSIPSGDQNQVQANQIDENQQLVDYGANSNQPQEEVIDQVENQQVVDQSIQSNQDAQITADQAANNVVDDANVVDIMDTETPPIEETATNEQEIIDNTEDSDIGSVDASATDEYIPQTQSDEEEYNPQSMAAWGYELPKAQSSISDIMLRNQDLSVLNNNSSSSSSSGSDDLGEYNNPGSSNFIPFINPAGSSYGSSYSQAQVDDILKRYAIELEQANSLYNQQMLDQIQQFKNSYQSPSIEQQMLMLGVTGAQQPNDEMVEVWENHIEAGGTPPDSPDVNYTQAYKNIHGEDAMPTYKNAQNNKDNQVVQHITNVYNTPEQKANDLKTAYINESIMRGYQQNPYPTEGEDEQSQFSQYIPRRRQNQLNFDDPNSPYYAGASWTMRDGGSIPEFKKGGTITYNGREYTKKELKKIRKNNPALYRQITNSVQGTESRNIIDEINASRQDIEATEETTQYLTSGEEDWNEYYQGEGEDNVQFRNDRYENYVTVAEQNNLTPLSEEEFHKNYVTFQKQNRWMNENMTEDQLNNPGWDRKHEYTPCGEGEDGCVEIDGQMWKKGDEKGVNWQYNAAMENAGMTPMDQEMIKHMQAGFMGGKMMEMSEDERAQLLHTGVGDQTWQGFNISGADGFWGNTTNRQLEGSQKVTPGEDAQPCANAEEMEAACVEAGGNWTPYVAAVTEEDGTVTTPASGCQCDKPIDVPEEKVPEEKDTPFWIQDEMAIANALDDKLSLKKRYPWAPFYQKPQIDAVFKDPTREIAAIGEMAAQATDAATAFGGGAQRALAGALAAQGNAMKGISDAVNKVQGDNVTVANTINTKNAEMEYKTQLLNNNEAKQLYDNTVLTDENYDNALRKANAKLTSAMQHAYTNRANTHNLNSIYPQFDIDPSSGGMIDITDPKAFHADPNYKDPQTHLENYTKTIDELKRSGVPQDQWPKYQMPNQGPSTSWAQQNQQAITQGGYNQQGRRGREMRILKKGMELRNWFSPLRGK